MAEELCREICALYASLASSAFSINPTVPNSEQEVAGASRIWKKVRFSDIVERRTFQRFLEEYPETRPIRIENEKLRKAFVYFRSNSEFLDRYLECCRMISWDEHDPLYANYQRLIQTPVDDESAQELFSLSLLEDKRVSELLQTIYGYEYDDWEDEKDVYHRLLSLMKKKNPRKTIVQMFQMEKQDFILDTFFS